MNCPNCNREIEDHSRFCEKCGKKIPRCPKCGRFINERVRFCIYDGTRLPEEVLALIPQEQDPEIAVYEAAVKKNLDEVLGFSADDVKIKRQQNNTAEQQRNVQTENSGNTVTDEKQPARHSFCVKCGRICDQGQMLCRNCQVKALNVKKQEPEPEAVEEKEKKEKNLLPIVIIIITLLLLLLIGCTVVVAMTQGWFSSTSSGELQNKPDDEEEEDDDETDENSIDTEEDSTADEEPATIYEPDTIAYTVGEKDETQETKQAETVYLDTTKESTDAADETGDQTFIAVENETIAEIEIVHSYEIIQADLSWEDARKACEQKGGHLATITSQEEYEQICSLADDAGLKYLWLGAALETDEDDWGSINWITGERWSYSRWYPGEPSGEDQDGTKEKCLCMWNAKYNDVDLGWTFNDQRNNLVEEYPSCAGMVGYVCEYETEVKTWKKN